MSYCYGTRLQADPNDPLIQQLRQELYCQPYEEIDWSEVRNTVAPVDVYAPHHWLLDVANSVFVRYEHYQWPWLRDRALHEVLDQIRAEDLNTKFIGIGPISKIINMLVMWHAEGPQSYSFRAHRDRIPDYLWLNHDGMRMQGTNGSQVFHGVSPVNTFI
jgi:lanosterol synthase